MKELLKAEFDDLSRIIKSKGFIEQGLRPEMGQFPKTCRCCGKEFNSLYEYVEQTEPINHQLYQVLPSKAFDFRNCVCGSSLVVSYLMERDLTPQGDLQRDVFNHCLRKMRPYSDEAADLLRVVFRYVLLLGPDFLDSSECGEIFQKIQVEINKAG